MPHFFDKDNYNEDDYIYGGTGEDLIFSRQGDDCLFGVDDDLMPDEVFYSGSNDDYLIDSQDCAYVDLDDVLDGGSGDDFLIAGIDHNPLIYGQSRNHDRLAALDHRHRATNSGRPYSRSLMACRFRPRFGHKRGRRG